MAFCGVGGTIKTQCLGEAFGLLGNRLNEKDCGSQPLPR